jgi:prepilin-type N-terminal cleavage/methylation domain-containing protein
MMNKGTRDGFTLIEVCLVMMIFGIAVTSLMALFPVSLRQGNQAVSDSVVTTFGDSVMNALAGRASSMQTIGDWRYWRTPNQFKTEVVRDIRVYEGGPNLRLGEDTIPNYLGTDENVTIKYRLEIDTVNTAQFGPRLYRAILYASDNKYADLDEAGTVFVTYMFYFGEVP